MLLKILSLQIFLLPFISLNCEAKLSVECIVDYLHFKHFELDYFASVKSLNGNPSECSDDIRAKMEALYNDVRTRLNHHALKKAHTECVIQGMKKDSNYENYRLAVEAAELKGVGLRFWKSGEKSRFIEEYLKKSQEIEDNSFVSCQGQKSYGDFFDAYFNQKKNEQISDNLDYCMRKYLKDKNIINIGQYGFNINPKGIATDRIRCDDIMKEKFEEMKAQIIADGGKQCSVEKFISNGYLDEMLKIQLLSKLNVAQAEKDEEKKKFVSHMVSLTNIIKSCPA